MAKEPILIVGGGRAAASLVESYRDAGGQAGITIVSREEQPPYDRPPLSKGVLRGEMPAGDAIVHAPEQYDDLVVELRLGSEVSSIDLAMRTVGLRSGEALEYGTLVIASGARPRPLDVPGADLPAVHTFRTLDDAEAVRADAEDARKALVVGGSFIGSEVAASLRMLGLEVTLVELGAHLVPALASTELSEQVEELFREQGVEVTLGDEIAEFTANGKMLTGARTTSGRSIEAFVAIVGVGVTPETAFLEGSEIVIEDGVVVDDHFRASVPDVYAIGDVASFDDVVSGRRRRIEHWSNADAQGRYLGASFAGARKGYAQVPVFFTKLFDLQLQLIGDTEGVDEVILRGSITERSLVGFYLKQERLVAAAVVGQTEDMADELKGLVRERALLSDRSRATNASVRPAAVFEC